jgi:hypothetical protein
MFVAQSPAGTVYFKMPVLLDSDNFNMIMAEVHGLLSTFAAVAQPGWFTRELTRIFHYMFPNQPKRQADATATAPNKKQCCRP